MANTRTYVHDRHTVVDPAGNEIVMLHANTLDDVYTDPKSSVSAKGKIIFTVTCDTAAGTAAKVVSVPGYALIAGGHLVVKFTNGITVPGATLNVNNTGAKPIILNDQPLPAGVILPKNQIILKYNGSSFDIVGGAGSTHVSRNDAKKIYFIGVDEVSTDGTPAKEYFNSKVYINAAGDTVVSPKFEGDGSALSNLNASNIKGGTLNAARLPESGVSAGSYGSGSNATLGFGDTFNIPYVTVDKYGRATSVKNVALKLPANPDTDAKVTTTANNSATYYIAGTTSSATATGTLVHNTGVYVAGGVLTSPLMEAHTIYLNPAHTKSITSTNYSGESNTVTSISTHLIDDFTSNDTHKGATANVARRLSVGITSLSSELTNLVSQLGTQVTLELSGTTLNIKTKTTAPSVHSVTP